MGSITRVRLIRRIRRVVPHGHTANVHVLCWKDVTYAMTSWFTAKGLFVLQLFVESPLLWGYLHSLLFRLCCGGKINKSLVAICKKFYKIVRSGLKGSGKNSIAREANREHDRWQGPGFKSLLLLFYIFSNKFCTNFHSDDAPGAGEVGVERVVLLTSGKKL